MSDQKTIVIGGAGFLGSHFIDVLMEKTKDQIVCIDNFSMGNRKNLSRHLENSRLQIHSVDMCDFKAMEKACKGAHRIAHFAALKIPRYGGRKDTLTINVFGTKNVLDIAHKESARVLIISTSDVYGKNPNVPFKESNDIVLGRSTSARWAYAISKLYDEQMAYAYEEAHQIKMSIVRIFGSYGPRHHLSWWGGPQSVFISKLMKGESIEIHGDGQQTRSFCYVSDTVSGLFLAFTKKEALGEIINIGQDQEISILELGKKIHELLGLKGELPFRLIPLKNLSRDYEDVKRRVPDLTKAKKLLNWEPLVSLAEGLKKTIAWQKEQAM